MSESTFVPGMECTKNGDYSSSQHQFTGDDNFGKFNQNNTVGQGTVIPGMSGSSQNRSKQAASFSISSDKPIVGFIYSISRTAYGEFWPLYLGGNTIGRNERNSIILNESTVSGEHAVIMVRKMKNPEKLIASIVDARSTCGTMLNGESLSFDQVECKNNDIITIGENYQFLLILIDTTLHGLTVSDNFVESSNRQQQSGPSAEKVIHSFSHDDFSNRISNPANSDRTQVAGGGVAPSAGGTKTM